MADTKQHPQPTPAPSHHDEEKKAKPGASWKDGETHVLPKNNLPVVFIGFGFCTFLAALDQVRLLAIVSAASRLSSGTIYVLLG